MTATAAPGVGTQAVTLSRRQWGIIFVVAALQFVNILDFIIVMPIGPRLADALSFSTSRVPWLNGSYTATASVIGLFGALFLDRFDRRRAVGFAVAGLVIATALCGLAQDFGTLVLARCVAGAFGGPATSLCFAIIADTIPPQARGKAMGTVMGAFSAASVFGVPAGLFLAEKLGWSATFFAVAAMGSLVLVGAIVLLPPLKGHIGGPKRSVGDLFALFGERDVQVSYLMTAVVMASGFVLIPNIAAYMQLNLGVPEEDIKFAYLVGGLASLVSTQVGGRLVDKLGSFRVGTVGTLLVIAVIFIVFATPHTSLSSGAAFVSFAAFMLAQGLRNVSYNTLTTKVPDPARRATFQSLQSSVQHAATASAAFISGFLLTEVVVPGRGKMLVGMPTVSFVSMVMSLSIPALLWVVERRVKARQRDV